MTESTSPSRFGTNDLAGPLTVAGYAVLGSILCWTRLTGLDRSYWHDEIVTVADYVRAGPREILAGPYIPNNHELFSLLGWATSSVVGESEIALRLWSVIPYGLAFLAMSVLIVAALEANRPGRSWTIVVFCAAGLVGTWTLPVFGLAFLATGVVLLADASLRHRVALGLAASILATFAWYELHFDDLLTSSQQQLGALIPWLGLITAPVQELLIPALLWLNVPLNQSNGTFLTASLGRLFVVVAMALLLGSSPLLREKRTALLLGSGVAATFVFVWATRLHLLPRFVSFLLVPLFILLASGTAHVLGRRARRRPGIRALLALTTLAVVVAASASSTNQVMRFPNEAHKDAAAVIAEIAPPTTPVLAYVPRPLDLAFY